MTGIFILRMDLDVIAKECVRAGDRGIDEIEEIRIFL